MKPGDTVTTITMEPKHTAWQMYLVTSYSQELVVISSGFKLFPNQSSSPNIQIITTLGIWTLTTLTLEYNSSQARPGEGLDQEVLVLAADLWTVYLPNLGCLLNLTSLLLLYLLAWLLPLLHTISFNYKRVHTLPPITSCARETNFKEKIIISPVKKFVLRSEELILSMEKFCLNHKSP